MLDVNGEEGITSGISIQLGEDTIHPDTGMAPSAGLSNGIAGVILMNSTSERRENHMPTTPRSGSATESNHKDDPTSTVS